MKIWISPYQLQPKTQLNARTGSMAREGVLLKVEGPYGIGYADLFPLPEFGDLPLSGQLESLRKGQPTGLAKRSLALAERDAKARDARESLGLDRDLKNNALVTDVKNVSDSQLHRLSEQGFSTIKIKCGLDVEAEVALIQRVIELGGLKIRLDFNSGSEEFLKSFEEALPESCDAHIQYVEDPCAYSPERWSLVQKRWKVAIDHEIEKVLSFNSRPAADVLIVKPARQNVDELVKWAFRFGLSVTVTSSMDHAVGVAHAVAIGLELLRLNGSKMLEAGCLTLDLYEENAFSKAVPARGPFLAVPLGFGIGFENLFKETSWTML